MKKKVIIGIIIAAVILIGFPVTTYNGMVTKKEAVENSYSNIDTQLQRRADLIPNLVNAVKGYMKHESEVINSVTKAREKLLNANGAAEAAEANEELSKALSSLNVIVENYPELKANENVIQLQDELAGTENRIATARKDYNDVVKIYNTAIKRMPAALFASWFGFESAEYFEAAAGSSETPQVNF